jgi:hypothetical protein
MRKHRDTDAARRKRICHECVGETYLAEMIAASGHPARCSYCDDTAPAWSISELADQIEAVFERHYTRTSEQPEHSYMFEHGWEREGAPVIDAIEAAAGIPREAAEDAQETLNERFWDKDSAMLGEETEFCAESHYEETFSGDHAWRREWREFENSIRTEARFFSKAAASHLAKVFGAIDKLQAGHGSLVVQAGPGHRLKHLFRARVFQATEGVEKGIGRPDKELGPPPPKLASAGRMNAAGISVFYGATRAEVAISEVRPPVGSRVVVAKFHLTRSIKLLDLTALDTVVEKGSIFDPHYRERLARAFFLRSLGGQMTRPVMPDDQTLDYLPTQAIADFLATENAPTFDGIIFQSAQIAGGRNVVLFRKAARVEEIALPQGTEISVHSYQDTEDGPELDYSVTELVPPAAKVPTSPRLFIDTEWGDVPFEESVLPRPVSLRVDPESVTVHEVRSVLYRTARNTVSRTRWEKRDHNEF